MAHNYNESSWPGSPIKTEVSISTSTSGVDLRFEFGQKDFSTYSVYIRTSRDAAQPTPSLVTVRKMENTFLNSGTELRGRTGSRKLSTHTRTPSPNLHRCQTLWNESNRLPHVTTYSSLKKSETLVNDTSSPSRRSTLPLSIPSTQYSNWTPGETST